MPTAKQHITNMMRLIERVTYYSARDVFTDFVTMGAIAYSNCVDRKMFAEREASYLKLIAKYRKEHQPIFRELLWELIEAQSVEPGDILGQLYMGLGAANEAAGQYFSPSSVSDMVARLTVDEDMLRSTIAKKGFVSLSDPAGGAGAMIISYALHMQNLDINYQLCLHATLVDVDLRAVQMSYLQLSILHIPALVTHGNTLTMEQWSHWYTPAHILNGFNRKLNQRGAFFQDDHSLQFAPIEPSQAQMTLVSRTVSPHEAQIIQPSLF